MAQQTTTGAELAATERVVLDRLLKLYSQESRIYTQVLELSRKQGAIVRSSGPFSQLHEVLQEKKDCLARISGLEQAEQPSRELWQESRRDWSAAARTRMHTVLNDISKTIEEILKCEEQNDQLLLEQMR